MKYFLSYCFLWMTLFSYGQDPEGVGQKWTIKTGYSIGTSFALQEEVVFFLCREGCNTVSQRLKTVHQFNIALAYDINKKHKVGLGFGAMFHQLDQTLLLNTFSGDVAQENEMNYGYAGLRLFYEWDFFSRDNFEVFLNNGLGYSQYLDEGRGYSLRKEVIDYQVFIGIRKMFFNSLGVEIGPYFNTALSPFNLIKYNKNYYPYHFGINLNLVGRF
ncbi:MAG: hypothetical protein R2879_08550 [Saprospiraceae bacterium]